MALSSPALSGSRGSGERGLSSRRENCSGKWRWRWPSVSIATIISTWFCIVFQTQDLRWACLYHDVNCKQIVNVTVRMKGTEKQKPEENSFMMFIFIFSQVPIVLRRCYYLF